MWRTILLGTLLGLASLASPLQAQRPEPPRLLDDIRFLSDDRLQGRMTGSRGADSAAAYLARRFSQVGLQPAAGGWFQSFTVGQEAPAAGQAHTGPLVGKNVIGILPGRDPVLRTQTSVLGAHYDHLGLGSFGSLDPDRTGLVHNGADDNASGAAALIQVAARLAASPPARTVVFIAFGGEELGLLGSAYYVKQPIYPLASTLAMVNLDMVGRLRNGRLIVYGARSAKEFPALLDSLNWYAGFDLKAQGDGYGPSDHSSFYAAKRPVLHLFTDLHEDYHRTTDDWQKVNYDGLKRVADFSLGLVTALAPVPPRVTGMLGASAVADYHREEADKVIEPIKAFLAHHTIPFRCSMVVGSPADEIVRLAQAEKAQMIVMGTHGYGLVGRFFMGSVAQQVVAQCEVPVLLVK